MHGQYPLGDSWRLLVCFYFFSMLQRRKRTTTATDPVPRHAFERGADRGQVHAKEHPAAIAKPQSRKNMAPTTKRTAECPVFGVWRDAPPRDWMRPDEGAGGGGGRWGRGATDAGVWLSAGVGAFSAWNCCGNFAQKDGYRVSVISANDPSLLMSCLHAFR